MPSRVSQFKWGGEMEMRQRLQWQRHMHQNAINERSVNNQVAWVHLKTIITRKEFDSLHFIVVVFNAICCWHFTHSPPARGCTDEGIRRLSTMRFLVHNKLGIKSFIRVCASECSRSLLHATRIRVHNCVAYTRMLDRRCTIQTSDAILCDE